MPIRIDHVIAAANDLAGLEAAFTRLGFSVSGGGTHPHLGTRNRIVLLGEGYVELLGIADANKVSPTLGRRLSTAQAGWVGFAMQSADIAREAQAMRASGVDVRGPFAGQLVAPSGRSRSWRVAMIGGEDLWASAEPLPFLIQHDTMGERHRRELAGEDEPIRHGNGATSLSGLYIAVRDLDAGAAYFAHAYGLQSNGTSQRNAYLVAETRELPLGAFNERIVLAVPTGDGPALRRLDVAGEGVCAVRVSVADSATVEAFLRGRGASFTESDGAIWIAEREMPGVLLSFTAER